MLFAASSASTHPPPADIEPPRAFHPLFSLPSHPPLALCLLFFTSSRSNDANVERTIVLCVHNVLIPRGGPCPDNCYRRRIFIRAWCTPWSRCLFVLRRDLARNEIGIVAIVRVVGSPRGVAVAKYRRESHWGVAQNITDRHNYQAKRPKYTSTTPARPSLSLSLALPRFPSPSLSLRLSLFLALDRGRSPMARVACTRNDSRGCG